MPRVRRPTPGGTRAGIGGQRYPNRTDLNATRNVPARVATGQTYGRAQQQLQAMRTVPMAPPPTMIPPAARNTPSAQPGVQAGPSAAPPGTMGAPLLPPLDRPSERPTEPVTAGAATGPGPGPEALPSGPQRAGGNNLSTMLSAAAQQSGSAALQFLAQHAAAMGQ